MAKTPVKIDQEKHEICLVSKDSLYNPNDCSYNRLSTALIKKILVSQSSDQSCAVIGDVFDKYSFWNK